MIKHKFKHSTKRVCHCHNVYVWVIAEYHYMQNLRAVSTFSEAAVVAVLRTRKTQSYTKDLKRHKCNPAFLSEFWFAPFLKSDSHKSKNVG